ncbi:MAG: hypothetical protein AAGH46_09775 [Bacteroidota bacterium]
MGLLFGVQIVFTQNQGIRTIESTGIERIIINGDQIFEIEVYSENRKTIELSTLLDGEYESDFYITSARTNETLEIQLVASDFSDIPDDKRNAHKVVAATLKLLVPDNLKVEVVSDVGYLIAKGRFNSLLADLQNGYFNFEGIAQYLRVETAEGNIYFKSENTAIEAYSAKGTITGVLSEEGLNKATLRTIRGDISIGN